MKNYCYASIVFASCILTSAVTAQSTAVVRASPPPPTATPTVPIILRITVTNGSDVTFDFRTGTNLSTEPFAAPPPSGGVVTYRPPDSPTPWADETSEMSFQFGGTKYTLDIRMVLLDDGTPRGWALGDTTPSKCTFYDKTGKKVDQYLPTGTNWDLTLSCTPPGAATPTGHY